MFSERTKKKKTVDVSCTLVARAIAFCQQVERTREKRDRKLKKKVISKAEEKKRGY